MKEREIIVAIAKQEQHISNAPEFIKMRRQLVVTQEIIDWVIEARKLHINMEKIAHAFDVSGDVMKRYMRENGVVLPRPNVAMISLINQYRTFGMVQMPTSGNTKSKEKWFAKVGAGQAEDVILKKPVKRPVEPFKQIHRPRPKGADFTSLLT